MALVNIITHEQFKKDNPNEKVDLGCTYYGLPKDMGYEPIDINNRLYDGYIEVNKDNEVEFYQMKRTLTDEEEFMLLSSINSRIDIMKDLDFLEEEFQAGIPERPGTTSAKEKGLYTNYDIEERRLKLLYSGLRVLLYIGVGLTILYLIYIKN